MSTPYLVGESDGNDTISSLDMCPVLAVLLSCGYFQTRQEDINKFSACGRNIRSVV